jgi:hypothetical protein
MLSQQQGGWAANMNFGYGQQQPQMTQNQLMQNYIDTAYDQQQFLHQPTIPSNASADSAKANIKDRDAADRPLVRLSVNLIHTYKNINEVSYLQSIHLIVFLQNYYNRKIRRRHEERRQDALNKLALLNKTQQQQQTSLTTNQLSTLTQSNSNPLLQLQQQPQLSTHHHSANTMPNSGLTGSVVSFRINTFFLLKNLQFLFS